MPKPKDQDIPLAYLCECFDLSPDAGALTWRERPRQHLASDRQWRR